MTAKNKPPENVRAKTDLPMDADRIRRQLRRILDSSAFGATHAQKAFLEFVVEKALAGKSEEIKGYTVATRVFGRRADFDQATDPIVSIQANKLRRALANYYLVTGKKDPIRIDIPKGAYVPSFTERSGVPAAPSLGSGGRLIHWTDGDWPAVVIRPFQNLTDDPDLDYMAIGLATELAMEINRFQDIRVLIRRPEDRGRREVDTGARFAIDGSIRKDPAAVKVAVQLIDLASNIQIWGDMHKTDLEASRIIAFQEKVARMIAAKVCGELGIIARAMSTESRNVPPADLKTYEAMLRYYAFIADFTAESFLKAFEALKLAAVREPQKGIVWSMLARMYITNYALELFDVKTLVDEAVAYARKGVRLDPANQRVRLIMAYTMLLKNDLPHGLAEAERAFALNPNSLILMPHLGYLLTLLGDWERGPELIRRTIEFNPYYDVVVHYALWIDWIRRGDEEKAHAETLHFRTPFLFWDPLIKAATMGLLGRNQEGKKAIEHLLKLKPDFANRGRVLIKHFIKFDDISDRIVEGLNKVGLILR
jgi:TolB-like protein